MAAIEYRGLNAVTNFDLSRYIKWLKPNSTSFHNNISENISLLPNPSINAEFIAPNPNPNQLQDNEQLGLGNFFHNVQQITCNTVVGETLATQQARPTSATSALGLLFQSSKFKEMMEMTSASDHNCPNSPPPIMLPTETLEPLQSAFPDDVRTYFDDHQCQDPSSAFADGDDGIFSELNSFMQPMFSCDFDT